MSEAPAAPRYEPIAVSAESTVVAEFVPDAARRSGVPVEAELERSSSSSCRRRPTSTCRSRREAAPGRQPARPARGAERHQFTDAEWERFFAEKIAGANEGIVEKTVRIQEDHVQLLKRDDGTTKNITLIDKTNIHNNRLQVINQYEIGQGEGGASTPTATT